MLRKLPPVELYGSLNTESYATKFYCSFPNFLSYRAEKGDYMLSKHFYHGSNKFSIRVCPYGTETSKDGFISVRLRRRSSDTHCKLHCFVGLVDADGNIRYGQEGNFAIKKKKLSLSSPMDLVRRDELEQHADLLLPDGKLILICLLRNGRIDPEEAGIEIVDDWEPIQHTLSCTDGFFLSDDQIAEFMEILLAFAEIDYHGGKLPRRKSHASSDLALCSRGKCSERNSWATDPSSEISCCSEGKYPKGNSGTTDPSCRISCSKGQSLKESYEATDASSEIVYSSIGKCTKRNSGATDTSSKVACYCKRKCFIKSSGRAYASSEVTSCSKWKGPGESHSGAVCSSSDNPSCSKVQGPEERQSGATNVSNKVACSSKGKCTKRNSAAISLSNEVPCYCKRKCFKRNSGAPNVTSEIANCSKLKDPEENHSGTACASNYIPSCSTWKDLEHLEASSDIPSPSKWKEPDKKRTGVVLASSDILSCSNWKDSVKRHPGVVYASNIVLSPSKWKNPEERRLGAQYQVTFHPYQIGMIQNPEKRHLEAVYTSSRISPSFKWENSEKKYTGAVFVSSGIPSCSKWENPKCSFSAQELLSIELAYVKWKNPQERKSYTICASAGEFSMYIINVINRIKLFAEGKAVCTNKELKKFLASCSFLKDSQNYHLEENSARGTCTLNEISPCPKIGNNPPKLINIKISKRTHSFKQKYPEEMNFRENNSLAICASNDPEVLNLKENNSWKVCTSNEVASCSKLKYPEESSLKENNSWAVCASNEVVSYRKQKYSIKKKRYQRYRPIETKGKRYLDTIQEYPEEMDFIENNSLAMCASNDPEVLNLKENNSWKVCASNEVASYKQKYSEKTESNQPKETKGKRSFYTIQEDPEQLNFKENISRAVSASNKIASLSKQNDTGKLESNQPEEIKRKRRKTSCYEQKDSTELDLKESNPQAVHTSNKVASCSKQKDPGESNRNKNDSWAVCTSNEVASCYKQKSPKKSEKNKPEQRKRKRSSNTKQKDLEELENSLAVCALNEAASYSKQKDPEKLENNQSEERKKRKKFCSKQNDSEITYLEENARAVRTPNVVASCSKQKNLEKCVIENNSQEIHTSDEFASCYKQKDPEISERNQPEAVKRKRSEKSCSKQKDPEDLDLIEKNSQALCSSNEVVASCSKQKEPGESNCSENNSQAVFAPDDFASGYEQKDEEVKIIEEMWRQRSKYEWFYRTLYGKYPERDEMEMMEKRCLESLSRDFSKLIIDEELNEHCDMSFVVEGTVFDAHKNVIAARSPKLASVLDRDPSAFPTINVPDCDPEVFDLFLEYLYSGKVEELDFYEALELYCLAVRTEVWELKSLCADHMVMILDEETFVDALVLADSYDDSDLLSRLLDYFVVYFQDIITQEVWETFARENKELSNKCFMTLCHRR